MVLMLQRIKQYLFGSIFRAGASTLTILILVSNVLGLVRDMLFSRAFGASRLLDTYNAAFVVPDILLNVFVAGALTSAFIPIFSALRAHNEERESEQVATTMAVAAPLVMLVLGVIALIMMPAIAHLVAPGFTTTELELLIRMSRLMLLSPIIFALSNTLGGVLISLDRFVGYGLSSILYNVGIIGGVFLVPFFGPYGLVIGTLCGALLHLLSRIIALARSTFTLRGPVSFANAHFRKILFLMLPRMAGQPIEQLTFSLFTSLASSLAVGSIAIVGFARNFQSMPISVFGIAFSMAVFGSLSRKAATRDREGFIYHLKETAKPLLGASIISALVYIVGGKLILGIFLGGGQFSPEAVQRTAQLLALFAIAIPAENFNHLLARGFYALKDTWTPIFISVPGLACIYLLARVGIPLFGLNALGIAYASVITLEALVLFILLRRKLRTL